MTDFAVGSPEEEKIEGLDLSEDSDWGDYPIDTVLIRNENRTVHDVLRRIEQHNFIMNPDFQRDFVWNEEKQSKLIESVMMRIPLPVLYLAEDPQGRMIVVDGLQRLSTFRRFVANELALKLPKQPELDGKRFSQLSAKLQNRVEDCNLILYVIDAKVPERARLDIFERVNSGVPLSRQQMRNCLFMGPATLFLRDEAEHSGFRDATGLSLSNLTMRDREFVNRFCAFKLLGPSNYRGDMDDFLAQALTRMNEMPGIGLEMLSYDFRLSMANNKGVFGRHAFRKHTSKQSARAVLNASIWDVMSVGLSTQPQGVVEDRAESLRTAFQVLLKDEEFNKAITYATNDAKRVKYRFELASRMLGEVFHDK